MFLLLSVGVIVGFFLFLLFLSFGPGGRNYMSIDATVASLESDFALIPFIVLPAVVVFLLTIVFEHQPFAHNLWLISVGIALCRLLLLVVTSRRRLIRMSLFCIASVVSVALSYLVCRAVLSDHSALSTLSPNLIVILMWFVTILVVMQFFRDARFGNIDEEGMYAENVRKLFARYSVKYKSAVNPYFAKDPVAYRLLFAIMISEDINRPAIIRLTERVLFPFTHIGTTGIMQVTADEYLSNTKSIVIAQEMIKGSYQAHKKEFKEEYSLIRAVAGDYNGGVYPELVADIYYILKESQLC